MTRSVSTRRGQPITRIGHRPHAPFEPPAGARLAVQHGPVRALSPPPARHQCRGGAQEAAPRGRADLAKGTRHATSRGRDCYFTSAGLALDFLGSGSYFFASGKISSNSTSISISLPSRLTVTPDLVPAGA